MAVGHFDTIIYPRLQSILQDQTIVDQTKEFKDFFERMINLFPFAIWVNDGVSEENLISQVNIRLKNLGASRVSIHSAGSSNILIENLVAEIRKGRYELEIAEIREYSIGGRLKAMELIIHLKQEPD